MKTNSKTYKEQLNQNKIKILTAFQKNSTDNIRSIAKQFGFSKQKVQRIITQLEENHVIWRYTTRTDEKKTRTSKIFIICKAVDEQNR